MICTMKVKHLLVIFVFALFSQTIVYSQQSKTTVLRLKNGYTVKGTVVEKTDQFVKIKTGSGEIFEYKTEEIQSSADYKTSDRVKSSGNAGNYSEPSAPVQSVVSAKDIIASISIGLGGLVGENSSDKYSLPPLPVTLEYILKSDLINGSGAIGVGGIAGYSTYKLSGYYDFKYTKFLIGPRGYFHYTFIKNLDTYGGLFIGYRKTTETVYLGNKISDGGITASIFAGCRYFLNKNLAAQAELGWGLSIFNLGIAFKF
jgi:hypothetical protein